MILIINICKEPLHAMEFVRPIEDILRKEKIKFVTRHYSDILAGDINNADKIIICGTSLADNEFLNHLDKFQWLKAINRPVLGICGGAHILGLLLGYKKIQDVEIGFKRINVNKKFLGVHGGIEVYHLHQFRVLPEIFHKDNFYATLFHPEVRNKRMIVNFCRIYPKN